MRQISNDLAAVQLVRSPRARVSVTVSARGQNPAAPAVAWAEVVNNTGQFFFKPTTAVGLGNGNILKIVADTSAIKAYTVTNPKTAGGWSGLTPTTVAATAAYDVCAIRIPGTTTIRLFYINGSNHVNYRQSSDNGATWSGATTIYSGGNATRDLCAAYLNGGTILNGPWFVGFSTYNSGTGIYTCYFGYDDSGWVTHAYDSGWRAAGIYGVNEARPGHRVLVFRQPSSGTSRIRAVEKSGATYSSAYDLDETQAGLVGLQLTFAKYFQLPEADCTLGIVAERAYGGDTHLGVGGFFVVNATNRVTDEPISLPAIEANNNKAYAAICSVADGSNVDLYLVGDTVVYRGAAQTATTDTLTPIRYKYEAGEFEIDFQPGIDPLYVGQILTVTRTLSWGSQAGSESIAAYIVRVEQRTDVVKVIAYDALAFLGISRCRRPIILSDGTLGAFSVMVKLCARIGVALANDDANLAGEPTLPFTLQPNESLAGAAYRAGSQTEFYLVPANDGSFGLTLINPPASDSGDYDDTAHVYGSGSTQQPIARAGIISDFRRLAFAYILGSYSTDPEDGGYLAMAAGPVVPNTRPISYSLTNLRYNSAARVSLAATSEAARQQKLTVDAFLEGQANLALELYDIVQVTESLLGWSSASFRVRAITERYDRGRMTQRIDLGDEA